MKFLLTRELGRLAKWLRIFGFDTSYSKEDNGRKAPATIIQALREGRIIITRNHRLAQSCRTKAVLLQSETLRDQLLELLKELQLEIKSDMMFTRCILCNVELTPIDKERVKGYVPDYVFQTQDTFITCPSCRRIYWSGTHWGNIAQTLEEIREAR
jgi:hypothetical protein